MRLFILLCFLSLNQVLLAQIHEPVKWSTSWNKTGTDEYELIIKASIEEEWYTYSQFLDRDDGPVATSFTFEAGPHFELIDKVAEAGKIKKAFDNTFQMELTKISEEAIFTQKVKVTDPKVPIEGSVNFMVCNAEMCLPPSDEFFTFNLANDDPFGGGDAAAITIPTDLGNGGILEPVTWTGSVSKNADGTFTLEWVASFEKPWTLYSQYLESDDGPVATSFNFDELEGITLIGKNEESGGVRKEQKDPLFDGMNVIKFVEGPVNFRQKISVEDPTKPIKGYLTFMTCNDVTCLTPTDVEFTFQLADLIAIVGEEDNTGETATSDADATALLFGGSAFTNLESPIGECSRKAVPIENSSYLKIFFLGFVGGLIALLTPCVFPMIPLTVSFFTKSATNRSKGIRDASIYGFFILAVYLLLSAPFHLLDSVSPDVLNEVSTNVWLNLFFFAIFMFFAFSFFGYYELVLPSNWTSRSSSAEGIGGIFGIFFMALTLALVSFSCTGPILGTLLVGTLSSDGGAWQLTAGMGGFGLALALPFALFAAFPGFLKSLPKSGGWLNSVKVVLGFIEVGLAFKFLSNADLVMHWGILKYEPFMLIQILTAIGLGLYLFGRIRFPHDSPLKKLSVGRISLGVLTFCLVAYLASGFMVDKKMNTYRPLKLLSGFAPPVGYSFFKPLDCPQNLNCFKDLKEGLEYAKSVNKPVLIDFTGYACVNCRKMEEHVWPEKEVYPLIKEYVLISLYVDDKKLLPEEEQIMVQMGTKKRKLKTYGNKWSYFETAYFKRNSQPYYALVTPDLQLLNTPVAYTPDKNEYADFLQCGLDTFGKIAQK